MQAWIVVLFPHTLKTLAKRIEAAARHLPKIQCAGETFSKDLAYCCTFDTDESGDNKIISGLNTLDLTIREIKASPPKIMEDTSLLRHKI